MTVMALFEVPASFVVTCACGNSTVHGKFHCPQIMTNAMVCPLLCTKLMCDSYGRLGRRGHVKIPLRAIVPQASQIIEMLQANLLMNKVLKSRIRIIQRPFIEIAVLKDATT